MPSAKLISITPNYMELLKIACSKPYGKDITDKAIKRIIESGHLSVLEHCYASFDVECSVRVLGQLTRHRHLSFTVKSARGSEFTEFVGKDESIGQFMLETYKAQIEYGMPYEDAAYYLPQGVKTSMVVTGNFRAWYEYLPKRLCRRAMPEHRELAECIQLELAKACPEIFDAKMMGCDTCKEQSCSFSHK